MTWTNYSLYDKGKSILKSMLINKDFLKYPLMPNDYVDAAGIRYQVGENLSSNLQINMDFRCDTQWYIGAKGSRDTNGVQCSFSTILKLTNFH